MAFWKFCEARGLQPSIRKAADHLRRFDMRASDLELRRWLAPFVARNPHPRSPARFAAAAPQLALPPAADSPQSTSLFAADAPQITAEPAADPPRLRARDKESLSSKSSGELSLPAADGIVALVPGVPEQPQGTKPSPRAGQQPRFALVDPSELEARSILAAVWAASPHLQSAFRFSRWRQMNKRVALDLAGLGHAADAVCSAWARVCARMPNDLPRMLSMAQGELARSAGAGASRGATRGTPQAKRADPNAFGFSRTRTS